MESIRTYEGAIYLCRSCGQPCYEDGEVGLMHFSEQCDGVYCPMFPLTDEHIEIQWFGLSLETLKKKYPNTRSRMEAASQPR